MRSVAVLHLEPLAPHEAFMTDRECHGTSFAALSLIIELPVSHRVMTRDPHEIVCLIVPRTFIMKTRSVSEWNGVKDSNDNILVLR
jgi:hypothetical protein